MSNKNRVVKNRDDNKSNGVPSSKKGTYIAIGIIAVIAIAVIIVFAVSYAGKTNDSHNHEEEETQVGTGNIADIEIEGYGTITVALDEEAAPITVANFRDLANSGFYNGLTFHRIINGFMMQGGDPNGDGTGGSDNNIKGEFSNNGVENPLSHKRGAISMARNGFDMDSASSQFFIVHQDSLFLDGDYACFGYVTEGMDIVDAICSAASTADEAIPVEEQPVITSITVR